MSDDTVTIQMLYTPAEAAASLNIKESTLRKYAELFEKYGHTFNRNSQGHRGYTDSDVMLMKRVILVKNKPDMTLEAAIKQAVMTLKGDDVADSDTTDMALHNKHSEDIAELKGVVENQTKVIQELIKRLEDRDNKRDQALMQHIREIRETKQLLLEAKEEKKEEPEEKGFFARLFGK